MEGSIINTLPFKCLLELRGVRLHPHHRDAESPWSVGMSVVTGILNCP